MKHFDKQKKKWMWISLCFLFVIAMGIFAAFGLEKDVEIVYNPNKDGVASEQTVLLSQKSHHTVGEVLTNNGIPTDVLHVSESLDTPVRVVDSIELKEFANGNIHIDGQDIAYHSGAQTIGDLLKENKIELDEDDEVKPGLDAPLTVDTKKVQVDRVEYQEETREEEIPFEIKRTEDRSLPAASVEITVEGKKGLRTLEERVKYVNGKRSEAEVLNETVTRQPVTQVQKQNSIGLATGGHKTYTLSPSDFALVAAIVQHEGGVNYDSALAVMSTVLNRADAGNWGGGHNPVAILTAPGQFESYFAGHYAQFLGSTAPSVQQAVRDALAGTRNHPFVSFRGYETTGSVQIGGGNYYFNEM